MFKQILTLLMCLFISFNAYADEYETAVKAFNAGEYSEAFPIYEKLALKGDSDAQADLGIMYVQGYGVTQDKNMAVSWWVKSAEQGNNKAQGFLGDIFLSETSGLLDYKKAYKYYTLSAQQNDDTSQAMLGYIYAEGLGVKKDINKAIKWWEISAKSGNKGAIKNLNHARKLGLID